MEKLTENKIFAERYVLKRLLGRGGFAEVWLGQDTITQLEVAIKVYAPGQGMDTDGMSDFCKELSNVYNLNHTNLLKPQHVDSWNSMPYLVMTYCPQGSCQRRIGKFTEDELWKFIAEVASGLAYLHQQEIIHQDIKPDNILVDPHGNYVVTDFGISVKARATLRKSMNVASGSGTTAYMGPERFSKDPNPIKASDIWSLGATAYELLTGHVPFGEIGGGLQKGGADIPTINKSISLGLRYVLSKMLAADPWERPTADVLAQWASDPSQVNLNGQTPKRDYLKTERIERVRVKKTPSSASADHSKRTFIVVIATCLLALGLLAFFGIHYFNEREKNKMEAEEKHRQELAIQIHLSFQKGCERSTVALNERNFMSYVDNAIISLRTLEDYEKKNNPKKMFFHEEWRRFEARINEIVEVLNDKLEGAESKSKWEISGGLYQEITRKKKRAEEIKEDMRGSKNKSAYDIYIRQDDFK